MLHINPLKIVTTSKAPFELNFLFRFEKVNVHKT